MSHKLSTVVTGRELFFGKDELIVSKTDLKGRILYANRIFMKISSYNEKELIGAPHSILRHPEMPRCVFKLLWERISIGHEVFAYVINRTKYGDHYWVLAHVTPCYDSQGKIDGYHSNRRTPDQRTITEIIIPTYRMLLEIEQSHKNSKDGMLVSYEHLLQTLKEKGLTYDEFIFSLQG